MHFTCSEEQFGELCVLEEKNSSKYFGPWTENFRLHGKVSAAGLFKYQLNYLLMLSRSFFGRWLNNAFYVSGKTIRGKTTIWTKNLFRIDFGTWTGKCGPFRETFQYAGQNGTLHRQRINLKSAYRFKVWLFLVFADFEQKEFSLSAKSFGSCVKTAFYVFREAVWRNMFFFGDGSLLQCFWTLSWKIGTSWWRSFDNVVKTIR